MPEISRFYGIVIAMFYNEHNPPHFHVSYGEYKAVIRIKDFGIAEGSLPPKALALVTEWTSKHQQELLINWELAEEKKQLIKIEPLF